MAIQIVPMIPQPQEVETLDFQIMPWVMLLHNSCFNNFVFKSSATTKLRYFNCTKRKNKNMKQTKKKKRKLMLSLHYQKSWPITFYLNRRSKNSHIILESHFNSHRGKWIPLRNSNTWKTSFRITSGMHFYNQIL